MAAGNKIADAEEFARKTKEREDAKVFDLDNLASIAAADIPKVQYLVDGLLPQASVGIIAGKYACGKSTILLSMADAIANGREWCGFKTKRAHVLYMDRENPVQIIRERIDRMGIRDEGMFKIWSSWHNEPNIFENNLESETLTRYVKKHPQCFIIVDSLVGFLPQGASENDATHIREFMNLSRKLSAMGASVMLLHHSGKGGSSKQYRGSSDIPGSIDYGFTATGEHGDDKELVSVTLDVLKQRTLMRDGLKFSYDGFRFSLSTGADGVSFKIPEDQAMISIIEGNPSINKSQFKDIAMKKEKDGGAGVSKARALRFVENCIAHGNITVEDGPKNSKQLYWNSGPSAIPRQSTIHQNELTGELKGVA